MRKTQRNSSFAALSEIALVEGSTCMPVQFKNVVMMLLSWALTSLKTNPKLMGLNSVPISPTMRKGPVVVEPVALPIMIRNFNIFRWPEMSWSDLNGDSSA